MAGTDTELELLETYLDGELPAQEAEALDARVAREPELGKVLEGLRHERELRAMVWERYEPNAQTVERFLGRVQKKVDNHWWWAGQLANLRLIGAAAACIVLGWVGRGMLQSPATAPGQLTTLSNPGIVQVSTGAPKSGPVSLPIYDGDGHLLAEQRFENAEQAQQFIRELQQWQAVREQTPPGANIVPVNAEKF